jgi:hypothetical protein
MSAETVLVTGGTGYLARWCIRLLLDRGYAVRTTVRQQSAKPGLRSLLGTDGDPERLRVFAVDLLSDDGWQQATDSCDYVLHVASPFPATQPKDPDELITPARDGTLRVLGAAYAAGARRVVVTSSVVAIRGTGAPDPGRRAGRLGLRPGHRPQRPAERHQSRRNHRPAARPPSHLLPADHRAPAHGFHAGHPPPGLSLRRRPRRRRSAPPGHDRPCCGQAAVHRHRPLPLVDRSRGDPALRAGR